MASKVYVGNLAWSTEKEDLLQLFSEFGNVQDAYIPTDRETGRSRGFGFVTMSNNEEASAAIQALNNTEYQGRNLRVNEAQEAQPRTGGGGYGGGRGGGYGGRSGGGYSRGGNREGGGYRGGAPRATSWQLTPKFVVRRPMIPAVRPVLPRLAPARMMVRAMFSTSAAWAAPAGEQKEGSREETLENEPSGGPPEGGLDERFSEDEYQPTGEAPASVMNTSLPSSLREPRRPRSEGGGRVGGQGLDEPFSEDEFAEPER